MTDAELIEEGEKLSKPCFLLTEEPQDGGVVGYWGGSGRPDIPPGFPSFVVAWQERRHWITEYFAKLGLEHRGTLSLYEDIPNFGENVGTVFDAPEIPFDGLKMDGTPLYAKLASSFPPLEAVCLYASDKVEAWLSSKGLTRVDYDSVHNDAYKKVWEERCPYFTNDCAAMLGGWHIIWPEDDFYMPPEMKLLIWTFKDSEPWSEVWWRRPKFRVKFRIT